MRVSNLIKKSICIIALINSINAANAQGNNWSPTSDPTLFYDPNFIWLPSQPEMINLRLLMKESEVDFVFSTYINCSNQTISYRQQDAYYQGILRDSKTFPLDFHRPNDPIIAGIINNICRNR